MQQLCLKKTGIIRVLFKSEGKMSYFDGYESSIGNIRFILILTIIDLLIAVVYTEVSGLLVFLLTVIFNLLMIVFKPNV